MLFFAKLNNSKIFILIILCFILPIAIVAPGSRSSSPNRGSITIMDGDAYKKKDHEETENTLTGEKSKDPVIAAGYDHREYDSGDDEDDDDEEDEFLLITTSGYAAAAARPQMASSMYAKSDYDHQEYDSGDDEDDDEEDEFLLITTSGYAAAAARPQMASSMYAKSGHKDAIPPINGLSQSFTAACNNGSISCRKTIRTNPWIVRESDERLSSRSSCSAFHQPARVAGIAGRNTTNLQASMSLRRPTPVRRVPSSQGNRTEQHLALPIKSTSGMNGKRAEGWSLYASINRSGNLNRLKALDESTCSASSGYGSQDSSPESSVHSPDWQPPSSLSCSTVGDSSTSNILERDRTINCHSNPTEENSNNRNDRNGNVFEARNQHMDKQKSGKYEDGNEDNNPFTERLGVKWCLMLVLVRVLLADGDIALICLNRLSLLLDDEQNNFNSELVSVAGSSYRLSYESTDQTHPQQDSQRNSSSPIYAVPYEAYRHVPAEIDLTISNNNYTDHYRHVKPIYRDVHLPSSKSTAQYNHGSNDQPVQQALQISSPFTSAILLAQKVIAMTLFLLPSLSDSSSEDEPDEEMMEEGEQSSTSCSSWTAMLISPRARAQHRPCHFNAPPPPPLQQSMRARPNEFDYYFNLKNFPDNDTLAEIFSFLTRKELSENVRLVNTHFSQIIQQHARQIHILESLTNNQLCINYSIDFSNIPPNFVKFFAVSISPVQEWTEKEIEYLRSTSPECFLNSCVTIRLREETTKDFAAELMEKTFVLCKSLNYSVKYTNQKKKKSNQKSCWPFCIRNHSFSGPLQLNRLNMSSVIAWLHDPLSSQQYEDHQKLLFGEHLGRMMNITDVKDPKFNKELVDEIQKVSLCFSSL
uniref:F-box domain-containing protein n=1 Tax=Ditylenchus dipsaci TaxID=166011 RepID=A0A915CVS1_9BILA